MFRIGEFSKIAQVSGRLLRYYDEIGLLRPTRIGENGYRYYDQTAQLRLQQILFYRELAVPLADIRQLMESDDYDLMAALQGHQQALRQQASHLQQLLATARRILV